MDVKCDLVCVCFGGRFGCMLVLLSVICLICCCGGSVDCVISCVGWRVIYEWFVCFDDLVVVDFF